MLFSLEEIANLACLLRQRDEFYPIFNWVVTLMGAMCLWVFTREQLKLPFASCLLLDSLSIIKTWTIVYKKSL